MVLVTKNKKILKSIMSLAAEQIAPPIPEQGIDFDATRQQQLSALFGTDLEFLELMDSVQIRLHL